ncbi:RNA polymerase subunit sigma-24 [Paenibacillus sp. Leaf72]|nr:RNA polymerase subunit sigma-24 [Paenibacillus sp. Leaf72]
MPAWGEPTSDEYLIQQIARQDASALEQLYDRYERPVYSFVYRMLKDAMASEEVVQELFVRIWNAASRVEAEEASGKISTWIFAIARNLAIDWIRKQERRPQQVQGEMILERTVDPLITEQVVEDRMLGEKMKEAIGQLNDDQKQVVEWIYYMGYTQQEVADKHQIPLGTVKSRVRLALRQLRKRFEHTWKEGVRQ